MTTRLPPKGSRPRNFLHQLLAGPGTFRQICGRANIDLEHDVEVAMRSSLSIMQRTDSVEPSLKLCNLSLDHLDRFIRYVERGRRDVDFSLISILIRQPDQILERSLLRQQRGVQQQIRFDQFGGYVRHVVLHYQKGIIA